MSKPWTKSSVVLVFVLLILLGTRAVTTGAWWRNQGSVTLNHALVSTPTVSELRSALTSFRHAAESSEKSAGNLPGLLYTYLLLGQRDKVLLLLTEEPTLLPVLTGWAAKARANAHYEEALSYYLQAIQATKLNTSLAEQVAQSSLYYQAGLLYQGPLADPKHAWEAYEKAVDLSDFASAEEEAATYFQRGMLLASQDEHAAAILEYQRAAVLDASHARIDSFMALSLWREGQFEMAERMARRAIRHYPDQPLPYRVLGLIYQATDRPSEAKEMFTHVLELAPEDETARAALETLSKAE